ncbi:MAG: C2 family cysteine protease [Nannocystaceae bacterium]
MPTEPTANPFLEIQRNVAKVDPGALVTLWVNLPPHPPGFTGDLFERFEDFDFDGDGFLDIDEVERACSDHAVVGNHAAAVATLRRFQDKLDYHDDVGFDAHRVSRADLAGFDLQALRDPDDDFIARVQRSYERAKRRIAAAPRRVFADDAQRSLSPIEARQGLVGDCFFLAPLVSLALHHPDRLRSMISRHPRSVHEWTVAFPKADEPITVRSPSPAETALFCHADGLWPILLELAYGRFHLEIGYWTSSRYEATLHGGRCRIAIETLTGHDVDLYDTSDRNHLRSVISLAMDHGRIVSAESVPKKNPDSHKVEYTDDGIVRRHAYSVLGYDRNDDMLMLRNPWGGRRGGYRDTEMTKGVFWMPLAAVGANFSGFAVER